LYLNVILQHSFRKRVTNTYNVQLMRLYI